MSKQARALVAAALWAAMTATGFGSDAYVLRFDTSNGGPVPCGSLIWGDQLIFHNAGASQATVRLIGVSNGQNSNPLPLTLAPGSTGGADAATWVPDPRPQLWVAHLDVPDGVVLLSRAVVSQASPCPCPFGTCLATFAGLNLPVIGALVPPGVPSYHLGADVGGRDAEIDVFGTRTNVVVFNAGSVPATAVIEIRSEFDDSLRNQVTLTIPPNTVTQAVGAGPPDQHLKGNSAGRYVVVTVDQPSWSLAISLNGNLPPFFPGSVSP